MSNKFWKKNDELGLVKFVNFAKKSEAVGDFLKQAKETSLLPASGFDFNSDRGEPCELIEKIYNALCQQNIEYDLNEYLDFSNKNPQNNPQQTNYLAHHFLLKCISKDGDIPRHMKIVARIVYGMLSN